MAAAAAAVDWTALNLPALPDFTTAAWDTLPYVLVGYAAALADWASSLDHWRVLSAVLNEYVEEHHATVVITFVTVYILLQSFAIPGSSSLSLLGGAIFGFWEAMLLVCIVSRNRNTIFSYMLFLRVTPFFPNWFINLASPHVGVPLPTFFFATFIGVIPLSLIPVMGGMAIQHLKDWDEIKLISSKPPYVNTDVLVVVVVSALAALVPLYFSRRRDLYR